MNYLIDSKHYISGKIINIIQFDLMSLRTLDNYWNNAMRL